MELKLACSRCAIGPFHETVTMCRFDKQHPQRALTRTTVRAPKNFAHLMSLDFFISYLITSEVAHAVNIRSTQGLERVPGKAYTTEKSARSLPSTCWWVTRRTLSAVE